MIQVNVEVLKGSPYLVDTNGKNVTIKCIYHFHAAFLMDRKLTVEDSELATANATKDTADELCLTLDQINEALEYVKLYPWIV